MKMHELFATVREATSTAIWSKGVALNRRQTVFKDSESLEEVVLRVVDSQQTMSSVVSFWPQEGDWRCDCAGSEDPCEHVVAGVIALKQAEESGLALAPLADNSGKVAYRFFKQNGFLHLSRVIAQQGKEYPLTVSLSSRNLQRAKGPMVSPTKEDLAIDVYLRGQMHEALKVPQLTKIVEALAQFSCDVRLEGRPVQCAQTPTGFILCVRDEGTGIRVTVEQDKNISEIFRNGVALCGNTLQPMNRSTLNPGELQWLTHGKYFAKSEIVGFVSEILPNLQKKMPLSLISNNLIPNTHARARLYWQIISEGHILQVTPQIVYGEPILATLRNGHLTLLGEKAPIRDFLAESKIKQHLATEFALEMDVAYKFVGEEAVHFAERLAGVQEATSMPLTNFRKVAPLRVAFRAGDFSLEDPLPIEFVSTNGTGEKKYADPVAVARAWEEKASLVPLLEGGWAPVPKDWFARCGQQLLELLEARDDNKALPACFLPQLQEFYQQQEDALQINAQQIAALHQGVRKQRAFALPEDLQAHLRDYQLHGVKFLSGLREQAIGALLADDMGLGKTLQAISVIDGRCLVVAPTSVIYNWQQEISKFRPQLKAHIYHGLGRKLDKKADVVITTYAILRLDLAKLKKVPWKIAILDEAQLIKNPKSQAAQATYQISADFRLALSGTPIENRLDDIWSVFHFLNPALLSSYQLFQKRYCQPIAAGDSERMGLLRQRLQPFMLRRMKKEVAEELPPRTDVVLYCQLSEEEQNLYQSILLATRKEIIDKLQGGGNVLQVLEALLRLRQACCHPSLLPGARKPPSSTKLDLLLTCLEESIANEHQSLVFSQWTSLLDVIGTRQQEQGLPWLRIDGASKNRQEIVAEFQGNNKIPVLLLSLKAAGVGLNLTAADHVYIMDPWWNPAVEDQAADRAHRIGQRNPVLVHKLVSKNTVEEKILQLQASKKDLAQAIVGNTALSGGMSKEELLALVEE
jgi:superfamily II DNA or RNA helicase